MSLPLINSNIVEFSQQVDETIDSIRSAVDGSVRALAEDENELRDILGRAARRTNERQNFVPLKPDYEKRKRRIFGAKPILQASGKTFKSVVSGEAFTFRASSDGKRIEVGLTGIALFQQIGAGSLPPRREIEGDQEMADDFGALGLRKLSQNLSKGLPRRR